MSSGAQKQPETAKRVADASTGNLSRAELVETIRRVLPDILADENVEQILVQHAEYHTGPLPSPRSLEEYERILPGIGKEFLGEWKSETSHRRKLQEKIVSDNASGASRAQIFALVFALAALAASISLAWLGATTAAGIVGGTTVVGVVAAFLGTRLLAPRRDGTSLVKSEKSER